MELDNYGLRIATPNKKAEMYMFVNNCGLMCIVGFVFLQKKKKTKQFLKFHFLVCCNINSVWLKEDIWVSVTTTHSLIHDREFWLSNL